MRSQECLCVRVFALLVDFLTARDLPESSICQCELLAKHLSSVQKKTRGRETYFRLRYDIFSEWTFSTFSGFLGTKLVEKISTSMSVGIFLDESVGIFFDESRRKNRVENPTFQNCRRALTFFQNPITFENFSKVPTRCPTSISKW